MAVATPVKFSPSFLKDLKRLPPDISKEIGLCLQDLAAVPIPQSRRSHSVTPRGQKPTIFTVDLTPNKAWKLSYMRKGPVIWLLRVDTHRELDRDPGRAAAKAALTAAV